MSEHPIEGIERRRLKEGRGNIYRSFFYIYFMLVGRLVGLVRPIERRWSKVEQRGNAICSFFAAVLIVGCS